MRLHSSEIDPASSPQTAEVHGTHAHGTPRWKRRALWIAGVAILLALLVLTPPLVNANRYRGKIAQSMSESLGRPVHLDNVAMHLLPVPGFTLQNLVVSEDPAFGAEPTIRANTVEATLRVSSLWHRPVEFSTVRFVEPSVNLVRNAEGRWNVSDVLLHASRVESAPTDQRHAGPTPRFPYIEATGGRVNVKLGQEKLPFSLTDADFALWLPSAQVWRVRLVGNPARTDINITDPGRIRLEGDLRRAVNASAVPVDFRASWHDAPLGEASLILTGADRGWRGSLNLDATLTGTLGDAQAATKLTLGGLRRAEFFPAHPLDLQIVCGSGFSLHPATLTGMHCALPDDTPEPLILDAPLVHLQQLAAAPVTLKGNSIPARWALLWAALYSVRVPTDLQPSGTLDLDLAHGPAAAGSTPAPSPKGRRRPAAVAPPVIGGWHGEVRMALPAPDRPADGEDRPAIALVWNVEPSETPGAGPALRLAPTPVSLGTGASVTLAGSLSEAGYSLSVNGNASAAALLLPARYLPQLGDGIDNVLPYPPTSPAPSRVQFTCTRSWNVAQTCTGLEPGGNGHATGPVPVPILPGTDQTRTPSALTPRSLSPLESAPFSTPRPAVPATARPQ